MATTLYIEGDTFRGNTIFNSQMPPYGYGHEHVKDLNTGKSYTIIFNGNKNYSYEEMENGTIIYNF